MPTSSWQSESGTMLIEPSMKNVISEWLHRVDCEMLIKNIIILPQYFRQDKNEWPSYKGGQIQIRIWI